MIQITESVTGSQILDTTRGLVKTIEAAGSKNTVNTLELTNCVVRFEGLKYKDEFKGIYNALTFKESKEFEAKIHQEIYHYKMLEYALLQKIEFNKFYFKEMPEGSRKIIVHSEDCISTIQYIERKGFPIEVAVHMRSSEVKGLLPVDLLNILGIIKTVYNTGKGIKEEKLINMTVLIGSAHIYPEGDIRRINE